jgi:hypothetical protein
MMNNYRSSKVKLESYFRITMVAVILFFLGLAMVGTVSVAAGSVSNSSQVGGQQLEEEQQQQQQQGGWSPYQNVTYGVSMLYPSNWTQQNSTGVEEDDRFIYVSDFFSPEETDGYFAYVTVAIDSMPQTTDIEGYRNQSIDLYRQDPEFQEFQLLSSSIGNFTLAGMPAYSLEVTYTDLEFGPQNMLEVGRIVENRVYYIQYFADTPIYQKYFPIVQRMIESFQITS